MIGELDSQPPSPAEKCLATFDGTHDDQKLADDIDCNNPGLVCENHSVSLFSPGPVAAEEHLVRIVISPTDLDSETGLLSEAPFSKVFRNGISVLRSIASRDDVEAIVAERLQSKAGGSTKSVLAVLRTEVGPPEGIRSELDDQGERLFGVYDQTVPRADTTLPPVATHCGIFLRRPPPGTADRKALQKDYAGRLKEMFEASQIALQDLCGGILVELNQRAADGEFTAPDE